MSAIEKEDEREWHPSCLEESLLLAECKIRRDRRSGPGGQHRNKVETAVVITHQPTEVTAEASERRSQAQNRAVAIFRLRLLLALEHHCHHLSQETSRLWETRCKNGKLGVSEEHNDFPAILAEAICAIRTAEFDVGEAARQKSTNTSQLIRLLKKHPAAWTLVNRERQKRKLHRLK